MVEIYVTRKIMMILIDWRSDNWGGDKRRKKRKIFYVLVMCLGRIGIEDVCFCVEISRLSQICGFVVYFVIVGWLLHLILGGKIGIFLIFYCMRELIL